MRAEQKAYVGGAVPNNYERHLVPLLFRDYAVDLASRLDAPAGGSVLETACGSGALTRQLCERLSPGIRLTATDLGQPMVDLAQQVVGHRPGLEYRLADATDLPFADASFDAVTCQFGLMLFPNILKGMQEAARVLKPGGGFVFNVWDRLERNGFSRAVHEAMPQIFPEDPPRFLEIPYSYFDLSVLVRNLQQAGFDTIEIVVQPRQSRASGPKQVAAGLAAGTPLASQIAERNTMSLQEATRAVEEIISQQFGSGPISAPMQAFQVSAFLPTD